LIGAGCHTLDRVDVTTDIEIERPRSEVSAYASNPDHAPQWYENIERVEWDTPKPLAIGSRVAFVANFLGRTLEYTYEFRQLDDERLVMSTAQGPFPMETTYTWRDTPSGGTRMTLRNRGRPAGFSKLMSPLMGTAVRRANRKDLANLKRILEGQADR
jgi:hypothetical protein